MTESQARSRNEMHALLADDDPGIRLTLGALLESKGFVVSAVGNGREALDRLAENTFDIVLLDIQMPEMDGFEACRAMRELENGKTIPVLMLTGQDDTVSIKKAFEVGATDFIAKPLNYVLIGFRIDYILRASGIAEELRKSQQRSSYAQRIANLGHVEWSMNREIVHCSRGIREILLLPEEAGFSNLSQFMARVHPEDRDRVESAINLALTAGEAMSLEHRMLRSDGDTRYVLQISEQRPKPGRADRLVVTLQDITDRIDIEKRMHALAYYDDLTGLPNRSLLIQQLDHQVKNVLRYRHTTAVIVFGVDRFEKVVESLDHGSLERLITTIAERIKDCCRGSDLLSRQSGGQGDEALTANQQLAAKLTNDEYVIVLSEISNPQSASTFLQRLMERFEAAIDLGDKAVFVTTSAGISVAPIDSVIPDELLKYAVIARRFASQEGPGRFRYFKQALNEQVTRKFDLANDLRKALAEEQLKVHYQPKLSLADGKLHGVEALCRWKHPTLGPVSPAEFIEIAEDEGLIGELGRWVLQTACNQMLAWQSQMNCDFVVSVNISPDQLLDEQAMQSIAEFISGSPIDNRLIEFELTESTLLANFDSTLDNLNRFVDMGCGLAIDDFGTGYCSLSYLGQLPAKTLKIDQSFVRQIDTNSQYTSIVVGIIKLAHSLGMTVVAEGVETDDQRAILAQGLCDQIQGALVSLPLSAQAFSDWYLARQDGVSSCEYAPEDSGTINLWRQKYSTR